MKVLLRALLLFAILFMLTCLPAIAATPGEYGYYDANEDGKIELADALSFLEEMLDPETTCRLRQVLHTAKAAATSASVEAILISLDTETQTATLSSDLLENFTVPFATLGLTAETDLTALSGKTVNLTVPSPASQFFESYDASKLLAARPVPLIPIEEPETNAVTDISFSPSGAYLKFTITPPEDETGIAKYMLLLYEEGNDAGRIGWPVNAEYCEYIGLERFDPAIRYDTATVYAYDTEENVLSTYTEKFSITHTDASMTITGAYVEPLANHGGVFFSEVLSSSCILSFYDANGNKMAFQNWLDANSTVSDLYEYDGYSLRNVASVEIERSTGVVVTETDNGSLLNIVTISSNRAQITAYPDTMCLGVASNPHIDEFNCLAWDEPSDLPAEHYYTLFLRTTDGSWVEIGSIDGNIYAINSLPAGTYDKIRIYTIPGWDCRASYGYGIFEADFSFTAGA